MTMLENTIKSVQRVFGAWYHVVFQIHQAPKNEVLAPQNSEYCPKVAPIKVRRNLLQIFEAAILLHILTIHWPLLFFSAG